MVPSPLLLGSSPSRHTHGPRSDDGRSCRQVATTAHKLLGLLAEGLGPAFQPYCKSVIGVMLLKLKDKKCVAAIGSCLDKVYGNPHSLDQVLSSRTSCMNLMYARVNTVAPDVPRCVF